MMVNLVGHEKERLGELLLSLVYCRLEYNNYTALTIGNLLKEALQLVFMSRNKLVYRLMLRTIGSGG